MRQRGGAAPLVAVLAVLASCTGSSGDVEPTSPGAPTPNATVDAPPGEVEPDLAVTPDRAANELEVTIPAGGIELAGTLRIPAADAPAPAIVLVHGSGPQSRDASLDGQLNMGFGFSIDVFADLASALQAQGFVVVTYDKRTCGAFSQCGNNDYLEPSEGLTVDTLIEDAEAVVAFLRTRSEVDGDRISVIGHSQGAQFVIPMLEADSRLVAGVMIAGPYRPIDQTIEAQLASTLELLEGVGVTGDEALALPQVTALTDMVDGLEAIRAGGDEPVAEVAPDFWRSWFDLTERSLTAAATIGQPVLVLNGEYDWNVPPTEANAWAEHLATVGADFQLLILPCVTHALNCITEPDPSAIEPDDIGRTVSPDVIKGITDFLGFQATDTGAD